ncbi:MFS transporter [Paraburkholderia dipogonis]
MPHDGVAVPQLYWGILVVTLSTALGALDTVIANVALPTIAQDLHASPSTSIWIVNSYQMAIAVSLLPLSSLGDRIGYRVIYLTGLSVFTLASLACALSHTLLALALSRAVQGFGAAGIASVNTALVRTLYPSRLLGRGVSINASVIATASVAGPTVAASILSVAPWPWLFAVNVPLGIAALLLGLVALPRNLTHRNRYDFVSALLNVLTLGSLVLAVDAFGHGSGKLNVILYLCCTVAIGYVFVRRQLNRETPLLPVDLLREPVFALSVATSICSFIAQMLAFVSLPFLLQRTYGYSPAHVGLLLTPWPLAVLCVAPFAGVLSDRYPAGILGGIGLAALATGLALLAWLPASPAPLAIGWRMALCGLGFGLFQSPNNRAILAAAPRGRTGGASGMIGTARMLGQTIGAALVAFAFEVVPQHEGSVALAAAAGFASLAACVSLSRLAAVRPS